jgi:hypothetical protein
MVIVVFTACAETDGDKVFFESSDEAYYHRSLSLSSGQN